MKRLILAAVAAASLCACATADGTARSSERKEMLTGSNIPRRDHPADAVERYSRQALENVRQTSGSLPKNPIKD